ncbi:MAG: NAD(P)-binding protein [Rubrivivax sp.]|jgi:predicted NAD/FAD-binding protein|nr:NAD(P)-binding protein [Rubrivivax sp.]
MALSEPVSRPADIAILGTGLAGLAAAWALGREHRVTLYEKHHEPGFTAASVWLPDDASAHAAVGQRIDVPLRVFYPGYYPTLLKLYDELGVSTQPVSYATSFFGADGRRFFRYRNLALGDDSLGVVWPWELLAQPARQMAQGAWRFWKGLRRLQASRSLDDLASLTLADYLRDEALPPAFVDNLLLPMVCTVATCTREQALAYPADVVADYLLRGVTRQPVRRAAQGADDVAARLLRRVATCRFGADVRAVRTDVQGVSLHHGDGHVTRHDHLVLATSARQALALLAQPSAQERACLSRVEHTAVEVLVHRDRAVMPRRRSEWSPVNAGVWPGQAQAMATIWVNRVQPSLRAAPHVFQTVAPTSPVDPSLVIGRAAFERPLVTLRSRDVPAQVAALHAEPGRRIWFCGSYAARGVPLLESAISSAQWAAGALSAELVRTRALSTP